MNRVILSGLMAAADDTGAWYISPMLQYYKLDGHRQADQHWGYQLGVGYDFAPPPPPAPLDSDGDGVPDTFDKCPNTPRGSNKHNLPLSQRRAESVVKYLRDHGVTNSMTAKGYGEAHHIANAAAAGRLQNRRVSLRIVNDF